MPISRRAALKQATAVTAGMTVVGLTGSPAFAATPLSAPTSPAPPAPIDISEALRRHRAEQERVHTGKPSLNGWEMEKVADDAGSVWTCPVPGTPLRGVRLRLGDVEAVLVHVIRRFHYEVDELRAGDVIGWRHPSEIRGGFAESNQASGTAVQIRPGFYPSGARGGFFPNQLTVVRDILVDCAGVVRWGGDDTVPDESLFSIATKPGDERLVRVAGGLRRRTAVPGQGAGSGPDPFRPERREAAERLARRQS